MMQDRRIRTMSMRNNEQQPVVYDVTFGVFGKLKVL